MLRKTKIVATISSLNCEVPFLKALYAAGMNVARLNTAHMSIDDAIKAVACIREVSPKIAIMIDTKGPEVRTRNLEAPLVVKTGEEVKFSGSGVEGVVPVSFASFGKYVTAGNHIMIDDGELELLVISSDGNVVTAKALNDGEIKSRKSVNIPNVPLPLPALSKQDCQFIEFAIEYDLAFIAHSFVRSRDDIMAIRSMLETAGSEIGIIAKVENHQGVSNLEEIVKSADGLMVARGDLGVELPLEEVPLIQKHMIDLCTKHCKPVITATQMLQSMIVNPRPTRAEVSDVANAVFDGTDAVMLSGETSVGKYPIESVAMMAKIITQAERSKKICSVGVLGIDGGKDVVRGEAVKSAVESPETIPVKAIVGLTNSGDSARLAAAYRSGLPLFFSCCDAVKVRQLALSYGVYAHFHSTHLEQEVVFKLLIDDLVKEGYLKESDLVACLGSFPPNKQTTNFCCFSHVGELLVPREK